MTYKYYLSFLKFDAIKLQSQYYIKLKKILILSSRVTNENLT